MPNVYLGVGSNYSASGVIGQGSIDTTSGTARGAAIPCPGAFPSVIRCKSRVSGSGTAVVDSVYAGPNHLIIREYIHDNVPYFGSRIRLESISSVLKIAGGTFIDYLGTVAPVVKPYAGNRGIALNGLPTQLGQATAPAGTVTIGTPGSASSPDNYYLKTAVFDYNFTGRLFEKKLSDGAPAAAANIFYSPTGGANSPVSINMDAYGGYGITSGTLKSANSIRMEKAPYLMPSKTLDDGNIYYSYGTETSNMPAMMFVASEGAPVFGCFDTATSPPNQLRASVFGTQPQVVAEALAMLPLQDLNGSTQQIFAGVRRPVGTGDSSAYFGTFWEQSTNVAADLGSGVTYFLNSPFFFRLYLPTAQNSYNSAAAAIKPAFGFDSGYVSYNSSAAPAKSNNFWVNAYPTGARKSKYLDVKSTQYGFAFLNSYTRHLEFAFMPHIEPWFLSGKTQVINKLLHAPPRSADYYPALNMLLGVDPTNSLNGTSLYLQNDANIRTFFDEDQVTHAGGGHVMALGTYNGAVVNNGTVAVWGSNRWGQCVIPSAVVDLQAQGYKIVDVAVSNAPPVFRISAAYPSNTVYSDELGEWHARDYGNSQDPATGTNTFYYSFPPTNSERYGQHINYKNLPGHVVVVTDTGRVYAWGNNTYWQCEVPDEIALVSGAGVVTQTAPTDPVSEVSAGAYHTVARTRSGKIYVWGAGGPWAGTNGRVTGANLAAIVPSTAGYTAASQSVHFGQSHLNDAVNSTSTSYLGLFAPQASPTIYAANTTSEALSAAALVAAAITTVARLCADGITRNVGQVTTAQFSVADPGTPPGISGRLKGMIAAGAFHTAIIDSSLKIQCIGAGRGSAGNTVSVLSSGTTQETSVGAIWGSSYSSSGNIYGTYPHYCQGINQWVTPFSTSSSIPVVSLNRAQSNTAALHKSRYFQNLQFKKVVCGPFTTHGIVYSLNQPSTWTGAALYSATDKAYMHNRVVSWGCAFTFRTSIYSTCTTGPTGLRHAYPDSPASYARSQLGAMPVASQSENTVFANNPAGAIAGTGALNGAGFGANEEQYTSRWFEIINRPISASFSGMYTSHLSLVGAINPNWSAGTSVGVIRATDTTITAPLYNTNCPVTISRFKVKDMASCSDFTTYIGYINKLSPSSLLLNSNDTSDPTAGVTFDYEASVFFTGTDYYNNAGDFSGTNLAPLLPGRLHANNPYSGNKLVRRNKVDTPWNYDGSTGLNLKTKSMYFGDIKQTAAGISGTLLGGAAATPVKYVIPTSAFASSNLAVAIVNLDNRPVAWSGFYQMEQNRYEAPLDLTLLPSVKLQSFKTGKAHIVGIADGDWPVASSLASAFELSYAAIPKLVSELGLRVYSTAPTPSDGIPPGLLYGNGATDIYNRPVLLAWGAGDGREYGGTLISFSTAGSGLGSTFGMSFLDTHAISKYDSTAVTPALPLSTGADDWENYYGQYRWNVNNSYAYGSEYFDPPIGGVVLGSYSDSPYQPTSDAIKLISGHHAVEAMQSMLSFRQDLYPTTFATPGLTARNLLNGTNVAAVPAAAFQPYVNNSTVPTGANLKKAMCCATAAETATSNYASLNSLLEYHSGLGYFQQSYTDYVVDYAAGGMHSAVLFKSACPDYTKILDGTYKTTLANFKTWFMADASGAIPFGNRKVCKLGIVGYGCEGQTAAAERVLADGSITPVVPMLFSPTAKVYCGDSYTLVTDPINILTLSSAVTNMNLSSGSLTLPINIAANQYSKRLRGFDVLLKFVASNPAAPLNLTNLTIAITYKNVTWLVFDQIRKITGGVADAYVPGGTATTTYRVSSRFSLQYGGYAYTNTISGENYSEAGVNATAIEAYSGTGPHYLLGLDTAATPQALSSQGNYYAVGVGIGGSQQSAKNWVFASTGGTVLPLNESPINVVITDASNSNYSYTVQATIEAEVDAGDVPYVIFGPSKSGVYNQDFGSGPSYVADIGDFNEFGLPWNGTGAKSLEVTSCPCEIEPLLSQRKYPKSFPADSRFICGTKKYGPSGNRENLASYVTEQPLLTTGATRDYRLKNSITANFFSLFDTVLHRPTLELKDQTYTLNSTLHVLPSTAFISTVVNVTLTSNGLVGPAMKLNADARMAVPLVGRSYFALSSNLPTMYNKTMFAVDLTMRANAVKPEMNRQISLESKC